MHVKLTLVKAKGALLFLGFIKFIKLFKIYISRASNKLNWFRY